MNKIYTIKTLVLLMVAGLFAGTVAAQNPSFTLSATDVTESIPANGFIEPSVEATNLLSGNLDMEYELVSNTMDAAWSILVCDNVNCYANVVNSGSMDPIAGGATELIFKITLDPQGTAGNGAVAYRVWDRSNPSATNDTITFNFEVTPFVSVSEEQLAENVKVFPQPADDLVYVSLPENFGKASAIVYNLNGAAVATQEISIAANEIDVTTLSPGMYILQISNGKAVVNKRIAVQ